MARVGSVIGEKAVIALIGVGFGAGAVAVVVTVGSFVLIGAPSFYIDKSDVDGGSAGKNLATVKETGQILSRV